MPLVTSKQLLLDAQAGRYAVGAFNVENMEMVQAVVAAAEELRAPVILQTTPSTVKYADVDYFYANVSTAAKKAAVPVVMHLDHGSSFGLAMQAFRAGYTSIMFDGSPKARAIRIPTPRRRRPLWRPRTWTFWRWPSARPTASIRACPSWM